MGVNVPLLCYKTSLINAKTELTPVVHGLLDAGLLRSMKHNLSYLMEALKMLFIPNVHSIKDVDWSKSWQNVKSIAGP
jgi:hypothetical protein